MVKLLYQELLDAGVPTGKRDRDVFDSLNKAEIFRIDNVAEYYFHSDEKEWNVQTDFPNIAPPFETFFLEFKFPEGLRYEDGEPVRLQGRVGILMGAKTFQSEELPEVKWVYTMLFFENFRGHPREIPVHYGIAVNKDGAFAQAKGGEDGLWAASYLVEKSVKPEELPNLQSQADDLRNIALLALSFMHCKNVTITQNEPHKTPGKRNKFAPRVTFKTLEIKQIQRILSEEGNAEKTGLKLALHICRGHFKTFSGKGLFGKYPGTFWWESQVRGDIRSGLVVKDYNVHPILEEEGEQP